MPAWLDDSLDQLSKLRAWGYHAPEGNFAEPAALTALALAAHGRSATAPAEWLAEQVAAEGFLGVSAEQASPHWPTSLAVVAWQAVDRARFAASAEQAGNWLLSFAGDTFPRMPEMGHNSTLAGWPWVEGTHSWAEPTAFALLALKALGRGSHPRAREAAELLVDRLLPQGGCNYGNTVVLGQALLPHVQPSGIVLLALEGESTRDPRLHRTIAYLRSELNSATTTASLAWGLLGLAAHNALPADADAYLQAAAERVLRRDPSAHKLALLALAAIAYEQPFSVRPRMEVGV